MKFMKTLKLISVLVTENLVPQQSTCTCTSAKFKLQLLTKYKLMFGSLIVYITIQSWPCMCTNQCPIYRCMEVERVLHYFDDVVVSISKTQELISGVVIFPSTNL